jgi:hypothetical protein
VGWLIEKARLLPIHIEPIKILKARVYQIAEANVLIRAASASTNTGGCL